MKTMRVERIQPDFTLEELHQMDRERVNKEASVIALPQQTAADEELSLPKGSSREEIDEKVDKLNSTMELFNRKFHFKVHEKTNRVIVQVLNSETGEIISEIPPEKVLDMMAGMEKAIGLIVDAKV